MDKDYYKILNLERNATDEEIRKANKVLAFQNHPERNQTEEADERFKNIAEAYEVLVDPVGREAYDQRGREGLADRGQCGGGAYHFHGDPRATFAQFFESDYLDLSNPFASPISKKQNISRETSENTRNRLLQDPPVQHDLFVSLEEIARGCVKKLKLTRRIETDDGLTRRDDQLLSVNIKPGWKAGTKITFRKQGDQFRGRIPSDVVFTLRDKPHSVFYRVGSDVQYKATIPLKHALCGTVIDVPNLLGHRVPVSFVNEIIKPQSQKRLPGHGLPLPKDPTKKGDLVVVFDIIFPDILEQDAKDMLRDALPN